MQYSHGSHIDCVLDPTTSKMLKEILAVEEEHADELADLLEGLPSKV